MICCHARACGQYQLNGATCNNDFEANDYCGIAKYWETRKDRLINSKRVQGRLFQLTSKTIGVLLLFTSISGVLVMTGLYQFEIIDWHRQMGWDHFSLPFDYDVPFWFARDIFYTLIILGWLLAIIVIAVLLAALLNERRMMVKK